MILAGCTALPELNDRESSQALTTSHTSDTPLGKTIKPLAQEHPGDSGIYLLSDPHEAFAVRTLLADAAQKTLDVQYYIWRNDLTGTLMMDSLRAAADRGVRVRVLLDDSAGVGFDEVLATLDAHDNIEVRLFNPLAIRFPRWLNYIVDFQRVNRRMHNKSFTVDSQATIIGGRNIGDEYFAATTDFQFSDLDVIAVGPVVGDVASDFDAYWNSESAYPVSLLIPSAQPEALTKLKQDAITTKANPQAREFITAMHDSNLITELINGNINLEWAPTRMISDDPGKVLDLATPDRTVAAQLEQILGEPESHIELVSSYFVPTRSGTRILTELAERGVSIRILTNSLSATDVAAVHAGYAKRRRPLLQAGIELYEMRANPDGPSRRHLRSSGSGRHARFRTWRWGLAGVPSGSGPFRGASTSLHAKTLSIDDRQIFVGSFNFDPRSAELNTELGFIIDSPPLSKLLTRTFMDEVPRTSYQVHLDKDGELYWTTRTNGDTVRFDTEPEASLWRRVWVGMLSTLPIEWML